MKRVRFFGLSTCIWCRKTKEHLNNNNVDYDLIEMDKLSGEEKEKRLQELEALNPQKSYPTLHIDDTKTIVGFKPDEIADALGKKS